ncbi:MAG: DPP IV N-terminal domain-containing protein [Flavobacteriaceae bacterium]
MQKYFLALIAIFWIQKCMGQDLSKVTLDRIYTTSDFREERLTPVQWMANGVEYVQVERNRYGKQFVIKHHMESGAQETLLTPELLTPQGASGPLYVEQFSFSKDESKMLLFTNSARVWRANTRGDYWVYDLASQSLTQIGAQFPESTLMFAKFSDDNTQVAYVQDLNLYVENLNNGNTTQLTTSGGGDIINGTFDWAYEEEFNCRDGFRWNPNGTAIAYWHIDASSIGTFYMINNTDDIYSRPIPLRYPKAGDDPSAAKVGVVDINTQQTHWIAVPGDAVQNYLPGMQWIDKNQLLIQQINRHQNHLKIYVYNTQNKKLRLVYEEHEDTWIDIKVPDASSRERKENLVYVVDEGKAFLRLNETDGWRHVYKVALKNGKKTLLTPGDYDVASLIGTSDAHMYYHASPSNSTQRFLYRVSLDGKGKAERLTPEGMDGLNRYSIAPKGNYALHFHNAVLQPMTVDLVRLPDHQTLKNLVSNEGFSATLENLDLPEVEFIEVNTPSGQNIDIRIVKPTDFDPDKKYPVVFHVYGEPWSQMATDTFIGMWNIMLAQMGYVVVDLDNRGTPCLKGSEWRKSIYRKVGVLNILDQAQAAQEVLKIPYMDAERTAVWGWSGGGSSTLNLMFQYPEVFGTGMAVAPVSDFRIYDNIYQERYMGLPQENPEDYEAGAAVTHAKNLEGNLLIVHGTGDDNVHYQSLELVANELIKHNKPFDMMAYPNRSHGIYEGKNTRRHLYTLMTRYLTEHVPVNK